MNYGKIIEKAFTIAWKYKYLWLLGIFADITFALSFLEDRQDASSSIDFDRILSDPASFDWLIGVSLFMIFIFLIVIIVLAIIERVAEASLISGAGRINRGQDHSLGISVKEGFQNFPRMFGLLICSLVIGFMIALFFVALCIVAKAIATALFVLALLFSFPTFFILIFYLSIVFSYAERFVMLENRGLIESIGLGWDLLRAEWGKSTLMGIIAVLILIALFMVMAVFFIILALPMLGFMAVNTVLGILFGVFVLLPIGAIVTGYFNSYRSCVWTFFFDGLRATVPETPLGPTPPPPSEQPPSTPPRFE